MRTILATLAACFALTLAAFGGATPSFTGNHYGNHYGNGAGLTNIPPTSLTSGLVSGYGTEAVVLTNATTGDWIAYPHSLYFLSVTNGSGVASNYLFGSTDLRNTSYTNAGFFRIDPFHLTNWVLSTVQQTGSYGSIAEIAYSPTLNKLYGVHGPTNAENNTMYVWECDPITMVLTYKTNLNHYTGTSLTASCCIDTNLDQLYVAIGDSKSTCFKLQLPDCTTVASNQVFMGLAKPGSSAHAIKFDGSNVWVTANSTTPWLAKLETNALAATHYTNFQYVTSLAKGTDEFADDGTNIWIGWENSQYVNAGKLLSVVPKTLATNESFWYATKPVGGTNEGWPSYGVFFQDGKIWVAAGTNNLLRISPNTWLCEQFSLPALPSPCEWDSGGTTVSMGVNEFATDGVYFWATMFGRPGAIVRVPVADAQIVRKWYSSRNGFLR